MQGEYLARKLQIAHFGAWGVNLPIAIATVAPSHLTCAFPMLLSWHIGISVGAIFGIHHGGHRAEPGPFGTHRLLVERLCRVCCEVDRFADLSLLIYDTGFELRSDTGTLQPVKVPILR